MTTEPSDNGDTERAPTIPRNDFETALAERYLEEQVQQAEVVEIRPVATPDDDLTDKALFVRFQTVSGMNLEEWLPFPQRAHYAESDLITLIEFTESDPGDLVTLDGKRVPTAEGSVDWASMRRVLAAEESALNDWDVDKRLSKVSDV